MFNECSVLKDLIPMVSNKSVSERVNVKVLLLYVYLPLRKVSQCWLLLLYVRYIYRGWSVRTIQGVAWTLFAAVLILVVVQVVFVVILLLGNSYVHEGVEQGRGAVSSILPEIDKVKRNAMVEAGVMIVDEYEGLLTNIYLMIK